MVFNCNLLKAEVLLACNGEPGSSLYRLVIGHDHALPAAYISSSADGAACRASALFLIHLKTGERAYLSECAPFVNQTLYSFTGSHLIFFPLFRYRFLPTALIDFFKQSVRRRHEAIHCC